MHHSNEECSHKRNQPNNYNSNSSVTLYSLLYDHKLRIRSSDDKYDVCVNCN